MERGGINLLTDFVFGQLDILSLYSKINKRLFKLRKKPDLTQEKELLSKIRLYLHEVKEGLRSEVEVYDLACSILDQISFKKVFILIEVKAGRTADVLTALQSIKGIKEAYDLLGPYDVIVIPEAADLTTLAELVTKKIQTIDGIKKTITCLSTL